MPQGDQIHASLTKQPLSECQGRLIDRRTLSRLINLARKIDYYFSQEDDGRYSLRPEAEAAAYEQGMHSAVHMAEEHVLQLAQSLVMPKDKRQFDDPITE